MIRLGLLVIVGVIIWSAVTPSADSRAHPTRSLDSTAIGRSIHATALGLTGISDEFDHINGVR